MCIVHELAIVLYNVHCTLSNCSSTVQSSYRSGSQYKRIQCIYAIPPYALYNDVYSIGTLKSMQCTIFSVRCTLYSVQRTHKVS